MIDHLYGLRYEETEPSDTSSDDSANGITIDAQYLYDRDYNGENAGLDNSDIELFSDDAVIAESEYIRIRNEQCIEDRAEYFSIVPEDKTVSDHIVEDLQGGVLFGNDSFSNNTSADLRSEINPNLIIILLCALGVGIGCGAAVLFRKIRSRRESI